MNFRRHNRINNNNNNSNSSDNEGEVVTRIRGKYLK